MIVNCCEFFSCFSDLSSLIQLDRDPAVTSNPETKENFFLEASYSSYPGDVSTSVLSKFLEIYFSKHDIISPYEEPQDFVILRTGQYSYKMIVGEYSGNGYFSSPVVVYDYYRESEENYNSVYSWEESQLSETVFVNLDYNNGCIYGNIEGVIIPSGYDEHFSISSTNSFMLSLLLLLCMAFVCAVIKGFIRGR